MENAATELLDDVGNWPARSRSLPEVNDGEIFFIERLKPGFEFPSLAVDNFCRTEQARNAQ